MMFPCGIYSYVLKREIGHWTSPVTPTVEYFGKLIN